MNKKILRGGIAIAAALAGVVGMSAFEAHVINVTAHIENALGVSAYGIDYGTVFPQEDRTGQFTVSLSDSFKEQGRVDTVAYDIVQKPKQWRDEFDGTYPEHRSLSWVDPDNNGSYKEEAGKLTITTGKDVEDLFGPNEIASDWTAPRKVMLSGGNFVAETKAYSNPVEFYQSAGLLAYGQDGDLVRLEITKWPMGYVVYMESQIGKVKTGKAWSAVPGYIPANGIYLRLSREGNTFKGEYSLDDVAWSEPVLQSGNMINTLAGKPALVGVAVVSNYATDGYAASFDYLDMNGKYQDFCRFLSKTKNPQETGEGDINHPSYYSGAAAGCIGIGDTRPEASGTLTASDISDTWNVGLKVPPIAGYAAQDWPANCRQDWVVPSEADYGCDLWVEVTGISGKFIDRIDFGNPSNEGNRLVMNADDWSYVGSQSCTDPAQCLKLGGYGGYDPGDSSHDFRGLMGAPTGCETADADATFRLDVGPSLGSKKLVLRHLDGSQNDSFSVFAGANNIGSYTWKDATEDWVTTEYNITGLTGVVVFKLVATSPVTPWCNQGWGQVMFNWAEVRE